MKPGEPGVTHNIVGLRQKEFYLNKKTGGVRIGITGMFGVLLPVFAQYPPVLDPNIFLELFPGLVMHRTFDHLIQTFSVTVCQREAGRVLAYHAMPSLLIHEHSL